MVHVTWKLYGELIPYIDNAIEQPCKVKNFLDWDFTIIGGLRGNSELSNGFELKNDELLALLELLDAAGVRSFKIEHRLVYDIGSCGDFLCLY